MRSPLAADAVSVNVNDVSATDVCPLAISTGALIATPLPPSHQNNGEH
jgi:hypothetical protein